MTLFQNNRALLNAFQGGDPAAMEIVYRHYIKNVENFVALYWYSKKDTQARTAEELHVQVELIQDVFIKAFSKQARLAYDGIRPYKSFLLGIAKNAIIDYIRKQPQDILTHACMDIYDTELHWDFGAYVDGDEGVPHPEAEMDWRRCIQATDTFIGGLDESKRRFVDLRFRDELPLAEVARKMKLSRGKARFLEKIVGRQLKQYLQTKKLSVNFRE